MILNGISILIIIASLVSIGIILAKHLAVLASIDVDSIPAEKESRVKDRLILERFKRKYTSARTLLAIICEPISKVYGAAAQNIRLFQSWLFEIREKHRRSSIVGGTLNAADEDQGIKISSMLAEARNELTEERYDLAERKFIDVLSLNEKILEPFLGLAVIYQKQREWEQARDVLLCACKLLKERGKTACYEGLFENEQLHYTEILYDLSDVYQKLDQPPKALKCMKEAVEMQKNNPKYLHGLILVHIALGERLKAEKVLDLLLKTNPSNGSADELGEKIKAMSY